MAVHLAKGARDFLPEAMRHRTAVMDKVREVFERFGFEPLQTPAFERLETLTGKYGDEGEKLLFKILARGEGEKEGRADMALRYDLTVPLARVLAMNPDLRLPFKRWQMAPVWRADRPQRGRFREFWQCDVDIAGSSSPMADAECVAVASECLTGLGFGGQYVVRLNDRRVLRAMARVAGVPHDKEIPLLIIVDKLDKIGRGGVSKELAELGVSEEGLAALWRILDVPPGLEDALDALEPHVDDEGREGVAGLREVLALALAAGVPREAVRVDPTLARGLDYYTGPVFEIALPGLNIGSVGGGGRYDGLVGMFSGRPIPCVGVSLGIERLIVVMEEQGMTGKVGATADALVTVFDEGTRTYALQVGAALRREGVRTEVFVDDRKLKAQLKYADARGFRFVVFAGPDEVRDRTVTVKDLELGSQVTVSIEQAAHAIRMG
jgi:histidyl-tRNA synthetase